MDKLDLLGVRYDAEMELKAKYNLAKEVSDYWKNNCFDDDFSDNCIDTIVEKLGKNGIDENGAISDEVYEIWEIIEKEFLNN